jgi:hypothetical protein
MIVESLLIAVPVSATDATIREYDWFGGGSMIVWTGITFNR